VPNEKRLLGHPRIRWEDQVRLEVENSRPVENW